MQNELILVLSLVLIYTTVLGFFKLFGKSGLYVWTVIATITANIEVMILIHAFSLEQTLGNILFASTFLVTDILSETKGKEYAKKAVSIGIMTNIVFILITQSWFLYTPSVNDIAFESIKSVFSNTPRLMLVGLVVYAVVQRFDVWLYHNVWTKTTKYFKDNSKGLWIRNNASTLISQLLNAFLFNFGAFWGVYDLNTLLVITFSSYVVFIITSIMDTPFVYLARKISKKQNQIS